MKVVKPYVIAAATGVTLLGGGLAVAQYIPREDDKAAIAVVEKTESEEPVREPTEPQPNISGTPAETPVTNPAPLPASEPVSPPAPKEPSADFMARAEAKVIANMEARVPADEINDNTRWRQWYCFQQMINSPNGPGMSDEAQVMSFIDKYQNIYFPVPCQTEFREIPNR